MENFSYQDNEKHIKSIINKCWEDNTFKNNLINNPIPTINSLIGGDVIVPSGKTLVVEDQTNDNIIYLNIPPIPNLDEVELTEDQLELVAGGVTPVVAVVVCFLVGCALGYHSTHK